MQYCKCYYVNTKRFRHFSCLRSIQWCPKQTVYKKITSIDPAVLISIWYQYQLHCDSRNRPRRMRSHVTLPDTDIITWGWTSSVYLSRHPVSVNMYSESCDSACVNIGGADKEYICFIARQRLLYLLGKVFNSIKLSEQLLRLGHYEMLLLCLKLSYAKKKCQDRPILWF